jgi:hypothetical protein
MSSLKKSSSGDFVIVRALADEPVRLRLVGVRGQAVEAVGSDESCPMPFHLYRTYRFVPELFEKMRRAFESSNRDALVRMWDEAPPFAPQT